MTRRQTMKLFEYLMAAQRICARQHAKYQVEGDEAAAASYKQRIERLSGAYKSLRGSLILKDSVLTEEVQMQIFEQVSDEFDKIRKEHSQKRNELEGEYVMYRELLIGTNLPDVVANVMEATEDE